MPTIEPTMRDGIFVLCNEKSAILAEAHSPLGRKQLAQLEFSSVMELTYPQHSFFGSKHLGLW